MEWIELIKDYWLLIFCGLIPLVCGIWAWICSVIQGSATANLEPHDKPFPLTAEQSIVTAKLASLVYPEKGESDKEWEDKIESRLFDIGVELRCIKSSSGVDAIVGDYGNLRIISVRGTCGIWDVVRDAFAWRVKAPIEGTAHSQFLGDAQLLYGNLRVSEEIRDAKQKGMQVVVTGHSLGAATAIEFASVSSSMQEPVDAVLAICAPRSGNKAHANVMTDELSHKLIRLTFSRDIVCLVPPAIFGYRHIGQTHYFDANENYHPVLTGGFRMFDLFGAAWKDCRQFRLFRNTLGYHSSVKVVELFEENIHKFRMTGTVKELDMA